MENVVITAFVIHEHRSESHSLQRFYGTAAGVPFNFLRRRFLKMQFFLSCAFIRLKKYFCSKNEQIEATGVLI